MERTVLTAYSKLFKFHEHQLDGLLRTLYRLLKWIDEDEAITNKQRRHYVSIVRAQLSQVELKVLFVNGFTSKGKNFVPLANKYALLDNLNTEIPILSVLRQEALREGDSYGLLAFSSNEARTQYAGYY